LLPPWSPKLVLLGSQWCVESIWVASIYHRIVIRVELEGTERAPQEVMSSTSVAPSRVTVTVVTVVSPALPLTLAVSADQAGAIGRMCGCAGPAAGLWTSRPEVRSWA
jgi:hypothetical protein